ncbi:MAG: hypothetical protein RL346_1817 [Verrucomicrobiota bacterium]
MVCAVGKVSNALWQISNSEFQDSGSFMPFKAEHGSAHSEGVAHPGAFGVEVFLVVRICREGEGELL